MEKSIYCYSPVSICITIEVLYWLYSSTILLNISDTYIYDPVSSCIHIFCSLSKVWALICSIDCSMISAYENAVSFTQKVNCPSRSATKIDLNRWDRMTMAAVLSDPFTNPALKTFYIQIALNLKWPKCSSTILLKKQWRKQVQYLDYSLLSKHYFVVFSRFSSFGNLIMLNCLSLVHIVPYYNLSWGSQYFYTSFMVRCTPDSCVMLIEDFIDVKHAFILERDVVRANERKYQQSKLFEVAEKYECHN